MEGTSLYLPVVILLMQCKWKVFLLLFLFFYAYIIDRIFVWNLVLLCECVCAARRGFYNLALKLYWLGAT